MTTTLEAGRVRSMAIWGGQPTEAERRRDELEKELRSIDPDVARRVDDCILDVACDAYDLGFARAMLEAPGQERTPGLGTTEVVPLIHAAMARWVAVLDEMAPLG